jgi:hypothetical protein
MSAINLPAHEVKEMHDFGSNPLVYHTNYFLQAATSEAIARWLGLRAPGAAETKRGGVAASPSSVPVLP